MKYLFAVFLFIYSYLLGAPQLVTYTHGSRLGDNLIAYLHAKYVSYCYGIPLAYRPFNYSCDLVLDDVEDTFEWAMHRFRRNYVYLERNEIIENRRPTLYIVPYFPEDKNEALTGLGQDGKPWIYFEVDWKDRGFRDLVTKLIAPKKKISEIALDQKKVNIAVHVREGGGFDPANIGDCLPNKFPPISFYADALLKVSSYFKDKNVYCYIFTDARDPKNIVDRIREKLPSDSDIFFDFRKEGNHHNLNVIEDFFSFFKFDVLIRPVSNFSMIPSLIHDYAMVISPKSFSFDRDKPEIKEIHVEIDEDILSKLMERVN